jgi:hypothetical protein
MSGEPTDVDAKAQMAVATAGNIDRKTGTCVKCPTCSFEIPLLSTKSLPREFSVLCPKCRGRKLYQVAEVHDQNPKAGPPQNSVRDQFGIRGSIG